jgi:hypothetical protein
VVDEVRAAEQVLVLQPPLQRVGVGVAELDRDAVVRRLLRILALLPGDVAELVRQRQRRPAGQLQAEVDARAVLVVLEQVALDGVPVERLVYSIVLGGSSPGVVVPAVSDSGASAPVSAAPALV